MAAVDVTFQYSCWTGDSIGTNAAKNFEIVRSVQGQATEALPTNHAFDINVTENFLYWFKVSFYIVVVQCLFYVIQLFGLLLDSIDIQKLG